MPRLPPGTVFDIIDHLADDLDVGTLSTCSLVSLSWMTHSRAHAFSKVMIANTTRLRTFLDLLHGGGHSFRFCVQELNVGSRASGVRTDLKRSDLVILLGNLPTLVSLLLANIVWDDDLGGKCMKHIPYYTPLRLTLLKLVNFTVRDKALSMVQLSSVIHLFSGINYLALLWDSDVEFSTDNAVSHACAKTVALPQLGELSLLNSSLNPRIIKWLCNGGIGSSFKALTVYVADESTLAALGQLLRSSGQLLETLSLYLHHDKGLQNIKPDTVARTLKLASCPVVQRFKFWVIVEESYTNTHPILRWQWDTGLAIIGQLPKNALSRIQVAAIPQRTTTVDPFLLLESVPWGELKHTVHHFSRLTGVDIFSARSQEKRLIISSRALATLTVTRYVKSKQRVAGSSSPSKSGVVGLS